MTPDQIIHLAREMRAAQKRFFAGDRDSLPVARDLEKRLDQALAEYGDKQGKLFGGEE